MPGRQACRSGRQGLGALTAVTRALVLARGVGSRMRVPDPDAELTPEQTRAADAGFKALMPIAGHPFLDYGLSALANTGITSVGLVVGPGADPIRDHYHPARPHRLSLSFVVQREARGTADAMLAAEPWAGDMPFLAMNADNLYPASVLRDLGALDGPGLAVFDRDELIASSNITTDRVDAFAMISTDAEGYLARLIEKPSPDEMPQPGDPMLVSMNCWRFDARIFDACRDVMPSVRGELELPSAVMLAVRRGVRFRARPARGPVLDLSRRSDVAEVARRLRGVEVAL